MERLTNAKLLQIMMSEFYKPNEWVNLVNAPSADEVYFKLAKFENIEEELGGIEELEKIVSDYEKIKHCHNELCKELDRLNDNTIKLKHKHIIELVDKIINEFQNRG